MTFSVIPAFEKLLDTYGKTFHTWHTDLQNDLPIGVPQIMMGFTADGQIDPTIVEARDQRFEIDSRKKKRDRADIEAPLVAEGADGWQHGQVVQLADPTGVARASRESGAETGGTGR